MNKKFLLAGLSLSFFGLIHAQQSDYFKPTELEDTYLTQISAGGTYAVGQDGIGAFTIGYNMGNQKSLFYPACFPGDGRCVADNGIIVGQEMQATGMYAVVMANGKTNVTAELKVGGFSLFHSITPDGSRACGYIINKTETGPLFRPMYCDITPNGGILPMKLLPCPDFDLFGNRALYCQAVNISDDGKTIVGMVYDSTSAFSWPIIFREDEDGNWSWSQPTESTFNPTNITLPKKEDNPFADSEPKPEDYMTEEEIEGYHAALENNPNFGRYWDYMSDEAYKQYYKDHVAWADVYGEWNLKQDRTLGSLMAIMGADQHYGNLLQISPDGKEMYTSKSNRIYKFNLEDDTFGPFDLSTSGLIISQILSDGTFVGCQTVRAGDEIVPYITYLKRPTDESFIKVTDYLEAERPPYYYWFEDSFLNTGSTLITGLVSFSDDLKAFCGGYLDGQGGALSYAFTGNEESGVEEISMEEECKEMVVYNINGLKVLTTNDKNELYNLPKGLYIVNGKKIVL